MSRAPDRFEELVSDALESLPAWVRDTLDNVEVFVEDTPPTREPTLLGRYEGVPLSTRGIHYTWAMPDRISLYRSTIEAVAGADDARLRQVIAHTVAHEIAHHLGISDDRLREIDAY
jgi:predicted Zn-dependent protease with MMP-like domain